MSYELKVRNYCIYKLYSQKEAVPVWAIPKIQQNPIYWTTIKVPESVIIEVKSEYNDYFTLLNARSLEKNSSNTCYFFLHNDTKEEFGFAIPVNGIIESIGFY